MVRPRLPIRLLAVDLDGTILGPTGVSGRVADALGAATERGVTVVPATGRMYRSTVRVTAPLRLPGPAICYQGALVRALPERDGRPGAVLDHRPLTRRAAVAAIDWARAHGLDPHVNADDELVMEIGDEGADDYERHLGVAARFVRDLRAAVMTPVTKVLAVGPPGLPEAVLAAAREAFARRAQVTVSHPEYLEWTAQGVHKGAALRRLAQRLRLPLTQAVAIGDQFNDLELLAAVGHGVAMGGAPPEVRAAARYVTARFEDDGAALAIEALVLGHGSLD